jgi:GH15 family glucan-1,4-alpha-glucosidase
LLPLGDYGVIGNSLSGALISRFGSIDWCCFPSLDSPSHFGALHDESKGGRFLIQPQGEFRSEQRYLPGTLVLETLFETPTGRGLLTDWMPLEPACHPSIYRKVATLSGRVKWNVLCAPRFDSGRTSDVERARGQLLFRGDTDAELAFLTSDHALELERERGVGIARPVLTAGQSARFNWIWGRAAELPVSPALEPTVKRALAKAHACPRGRPCPLEGPWHDTLARSAELFGVLAIPSSGAVSESLAPGHSGEPRAAVLWDSPWILRALFALGLKREREAYFSWICDVLERDGAAMLETSYGLDGRRLPSKRMRPYSLGTLGQIALAIQEEREISGGLTTHGANALAAIAEFASQAWRRPDHDPYEPPSRPEHFVASKALCWAALNCACTHLPEPDRRWLREREILWKTIVTQGFDSRAGSFVRSFSNGSVGASTLFVPVLGLLPADDPRVSGTLKAASKALSASPSLKGQLLLVSALARSGMPDDAAALFSELCSNASPLRFFADDLTGSELSGEFPSASVHAQAVCAALDIHAAQAAQTPRSTLRFRRHA